MPDGKPPRPRPPPVPSLPLSREPFPPADSERPPRVPILPPELGDLSLPADHGFPERFAAGMGALHDTPPPDAHRMRSTPPSGSVLLAHIAEPDGDPRDALIRELRQTITLYRERLTAVTYAPDSLTPQPPKSKAQIAGKVSAVFGKYGLFISGALGLIEVAVGIWFPEYLGPIGMVKRGLGIP